MPSVFFVERLQAPKLAASRRRVDSVALRCGFGCVESVKTCRVEYVLLNTFFLIRFFKYVFFISFYGCNRCLNFNFNSSTLYRCTRDHSGHGWFHDCRRE